MCGRTASRSRRFTAALVVALIELWTALILALPATAQGPGGPPGGGFGPPGGGEGRRRGRSRDSGGPTVSTPQPEAPKSSDEGKKEGEQKPGEAKPAEPPKDEGPVFVVVPEKPDGDQLVSLSFDQADIDHVLKFLAQASGKTIIKDPAVKAKVTIVSLAKITVREALDVMRAFLSVKGYAMLEDKNVIRIVPVEAALRDRQQVRVGKKPDGIPETDEIITQIMVIQNVDAVALADALKPLLDDKKAILKAHADTNTLVVIDRAANVRRVTEVIAQLDQDVSEAQQVEVIKLEAAEAAKVATELTELFKPESPVAGLPADVQQRLMQGGGGAGGGAPAAGLLGPQGLAKLKGRVRVVADEHTNSLIVMASTQNLEQVRKIAKAIDETVPLEITARTVKLQFADAQTVSDQVNQLFQTQAPTGRNQGFFGSFFGGGSSAQTQQKQTGTFTANRVVPDQRTNSVIVTADKDNMKAITDLIAQLDKPSDVDTVTEVFELQNAAADDVANTLYNLLQGGRNRQRGFLFFLFGSNRNQTGQTSLDMLQQVNVVAHTATNTVLVSGPAQTFDTIRGLVQTLDRKIPQVFIEVVIVDVTLGNDDRFGIEWSSIARHTGSDSGVGQARTDFGLAANTLGFRYTLVSNSLKALLDTLQTRQDVRVISTPHVMVLDNSPAKISIGERIPYVASQDEATSGTIRRTTAFQDVNIQLDVTPHVNWREYIKMEVQQTVNNLIQIDPVLNAPRTTNRQAQTVVEVRDGQTVVIGGIISERNLVTKNGVPLLRQIPLLGPALFESKSTERQRSELIVFLTPHIVVNEDQMKEITAGEGERTQSYPPTQRGLKPLQVQPADIKAMRKTLEDQRRQSLEDRQRALEQRSSDQPPQTAPEKPAEAPAKPPVPSITPAK